jgi:hypothetical protein
MHEPEGAPLRALKRIRLDAVFILDRSPSVPLSYQGRSKLPAENWYSDDHNST